MRAARQSIAVCKLSGAVGTYSNIDPSIESYVGEQLGLTPVPATQVIARDRHAEYLWACAAVGSTMEMIAVELRHLQRTEVGEVQEGFKPGQKGSSAMPHKRNPISAETISGLSRVLRGNLQAGMRTSRSGTNSISPTARLKRIILPDSSLMAYYAMRRDQRLLAGLQYFPIACSQISTPVLGWSSGQPVLLARRQAGSARRCYGIVQDMRRPGAKSGHFANCSTPTSEWTVAPELLDEAFDLQRSLRHSAAVFGALD